MPNAAASVVGYEHKPWLTFQLGEEMPDRFLSKVLAAQDDFVEGKAYNGKVVSLNRSHRYCLDLNAASLVQSMGDEVQGFVSSRMDEIISALNIRKFKFDSVTYLCCAFKDGFYFKKHKDVTLLESRPRTITWVYYFHRTPKAFDGGELLFYSGEELIGNVPCVSGTLVVFRSDVTHEVTKVTCSSSEFADVRFSINGFIRTRPTIKSYLIVQLRLLGRTKLGSVLKGSLRKRGLLV